MSSKIFFKKSSTQRRKQYIYIKNMIRKHPERLFYTDHLLENDVYTPDENIPNYDPKSQKSCWCDLYFLSKKYRFFYNACFITKDMAAIDAVDNYIVEEEERRNKFPAPKANEWFVSEPVEGKKYSSISRNENYKDYFDELDRLHDVIKEEVFNTKTITIYTDTRMDFKYRFGVGLYATLDTDDLTIDAMNNWIENFWKNDETISKGIPISYSGEDLRKLYTRKYFKRQP